MRIHQYLGWIVVTKTPGFNDHFAVTWIQDGNTYHKDMGYGSGPRCVKWFEEKFKCRVRMEQTPIGIRVYREEESPIPCITTDNIRASLPDVVIGKLTTMTVQDVMLMISAHVPEEHSKLLYRTVDAIREYDAVVLTLLVRL